MKSGAEHSGPVTARRRSLAERVCFMLFALRAGLTISQKLSASASLNARRALPNFTPLT